jgi:hypothetical protein
MPTIHRGVSVRGPVGGAARRRMMRALDVGYGRTDFPTGWTEADFVEAVMPVLRPARRTARVDWDRVDTVAAA